MKKTKDAVKRQLKEQWRQAVRGYQAALLNMWELDAHYGYWIGGEEGSEYKAMRGEEAPRQTMSLPGLLMRLEKVKTEKYGGLLPTPTSTEWKGTFGPTTVFSHNRDFLLRSLPTVMGIYGANKDGSTSQLSPLFTEEMMGFPLMWTALPFLSENGEPKPSKPTATPSSPK